MTQSITQLQNMYIDAEDFCLKIENEKILVMRDAYPRIQQWKHLSTFVMEVQRRHEGFFLEHEAKYPSIAEYCVNELENPQALKSIATVYLSKIDYTVSGMRNIIRRNPALQRHAHMFWENNGYDFSKFEEKVDSSLGNILEKEGVRKYFANLFRSSDSFASLQKRASDSEVTRHMEKIDDSRWNSVMQILAQYIEKQRMQVQDGTP